MNTSERAEKLRVIIQDFLYDNHLWITCGKHWIGTPDPWSLEMKKKYVSVELVSDKQLYKGSHTRVYTYRVNRKSPHYIPGFDVETFVNLFRKNFGELSSVNGTIKFPIQPPGHDAIVPEISIFIKTEAEHYYHIHLQIT